MDSVQRNMGDVYTRDSDRFQRWVIKDSVDQKNVEAGRVNAGITDEIHFTVDTKAHDNKYSIYLDCRKRKIFAKQLTFIVLRPIHTMLKFIFHVTIIAPVVCHVSDYLGKLEVKKGQPMTKTQCVKRIFRSIAIDSVRTLGYGVAITGVHILAVLAAPIAPNSLYYTRKLSGDLDRAFLRYDSEDSLEANLWNWVPCLSPLGKMPIPEGSDLKHDGRLEVGEWKNFLKAQAQFRREHRAIFNSCCALLAKDQGYLSAAAK